MKHPLVGLAIAICGVTANAATKTVTLAVPTMDCPTCPIVIKKALGKVPGVSFVSVSFDKRQAIVTFDDAKASVVSLTESTKNAGYPSTLAGVGN